MAPKAPSAVPPNRRRRIVVIVTAVLVVGLASSIGAVMLTGGDDGDEDPRPETSFHQVSEIGVAPAAAGCAQVERPTYQGRVRVDPGATHPKYSSSPPSSGWFTPPQLQGSFISQSIPVERVLTTAANGGVVIFASEEEAIHARRFKALVLDNSVLAIQDGSVQDGVAFVAWGIIQRCEKFSGLVAQEFIKSFGSGKALRAAEPDAEPVLE